MKNCLPKKLLLSGGLPIIKKGSHHFKFLFAFTFMLFFTGSVLAQQKTITGRVVDANNQPLPSVTVSVKGKANSSAITNENGIFSINAATGDILEFSSVGYNKTNLKWDRVIQ